MLKDVWGSVVVIPPQTKLEVGGGEYKGIALSVCPVKKFLKVN